MDDLDFLDAAVEEVTFKRELRGEDDVVVGRGFFYGSLFGWWWGIEFDSVTCKAA